MDILADNDQINFNPFEYTDYTSYLRFYTGDRELKFTPNNASNTLVDTTINFEDNMLHSVFFVGEENNLQTFITEDVIPEANPGNALVRVVHLSPDAPAVDLSSTGEDGNMPIFEAVSYKSTSEFEEIQAGTTSFELTTVGGSEVIASVSDITFSQERYIR